jgi:hypothetical protein
MNSPLFIRQTPHNRNIKISYTIHDWIADALRSNTMWMPNPDRPHLMLYDGNVLGDALKDNPDFQFERGDIVWVSFTVSFTCNASSWGPDIRPIELVRVGKDPFAGNDYQTHPPITRKRLVAGRLVLNTHREFLLMIIRYYCIY